MAKRAGVKTLALALLCQSLLLAGAPSAAAQRKTSSKSLNVEVRESNASPGTGLQVPRQQKPTIDTAPVVTTPATQPKQRRDETRAASVRVEAVRSVRVNFKALEALELRTAAAATRRKQPSFRQEIHSPLTIPEVGGPGASQPPAAGDHFAATAAAPQDTGGPLVPSPAPAQNYLAQEDGPQVGTGTFTVPPDTMGAVGFDKVFVNVNTNYRIQNKATGAPLSTVSINTFWASTGATGVFDPRVQFDPYQNRWILTATSNAQTPSSSVLVGLSDTADPQGAYTLFRFIIGCAPGAAGCDAQGEWADFPMLGFNKNWVAVGWNQFTINTSAFVAGKMIVLNYPSLRAGTASATLFTNANGGDGDFSMHPATTFSATEETLFVPVHISSAGANYRLHKITGSAAAPTLILDTTLRVRPGGGWTQPGGDELPQKCVAGVGLPTQTCPAIPRGIEASDAFIRSNVVFRNGKIWYAQAIALPAGGFTVDTRFAVQWTALNPDGTFSEGGRVDDPTATQTNGGKHYSYPSIGVNKNSDVLLGFSEFEDDDYADAAYAFRLGTDAAGTMRDPVVYKEGEDYYHKTFSGARNRWGDYSHTVVDPVNDRDMWTIQEYAQLRVGTTGEGVNDSRWGTWWAKVSVPAGAGDLLISEFRLRGPNGASDEFVEIYNASGAPLTVNTLDGSAGYAVAAQDNVIRCTIPNGTVIPARGHYLCVNSVGYSLASYPAGNGTTASGDATYTTDIPDNNGVALFNTATAASFSTATRIDAAGFTTTPSGAYVEGTGLPPLATPTPPNNINHAFVRDDCGKGGSITTLGVCPTGGFPKDTNNNASDFIFVDTNGTSAGAGQRLGAPGPENLSSPVQRNSDFPLALLDASVAGSSPPNRTRDLTSDPMNNSTFGTLAIRRRVVNNTGGNVTRLRFRVVDQTTFPAPSGFADLRSRTSTPVVITGINDAATCAPAPAPCTVNVQGTTLEQPPSQPNGGAFGSTYSAVTITLAAPLAPGASINLQFLLGIQQTGTFKFFLNVEALP